ncbi:hypothetical protein PENTCL1PPCAC_7974, partial [Pristionchus entomophagus]
RLLQAFDDLHSNFIDGRISTHWLLPCLLPLLRSAAVAMKDKEDGIVGVRKKRSLADTEAKIAEATSPLLLQIEEEKSRNQQLDADKSNLQYTLDLTEVTMKTLEDRINQLAGVEKELANLK